MHAHVYRAKSESYLGMKETEKRERNLAASAAAAAKYSNEQVLRLVFKGQSTGGTVVGGPPPRMPTGPPPKMDSTGVSD